MNTGNTENGQKTNTLANMAGVKIAPAIEKPTDASQKKEASNSNIPNVQNQPTITVHPVIPSQPTLQPQPQSTLFIQPTIPNQTNNFTPPMISISKKKEKKKSNPTFTLFCMLIFVVVGMILSEKVHQNQIKKIKFQCTPITTKEEVELDLNSTLIKTLYGKVSTNIWEDEAQPLFNDQMKLYLAYRQILEKDKYTSSCANFDNKTMEDFSCPTSAAPKAFKQETLIQEIKELYGENIQLPMQNIILGNSCIVGYRYFKERQEFVEGYCIQKNNPSYTVEKNLIKATSTKNSIILEEEVKYTASSGMSVPSYLKNGTYYYYFRLDTNFNYVLLDKTYEQKW